MKNSERGRVVPAFSRCLRLALSLLALAALAACAYPTRNVEATALSHIPGTELVPDRDTLIIVTASGGGTRATALTLSVLRALAQVQLPSGTTMDRSIDVISSVSGGSVAAGYFAYAGPSGLDALERDFVRQDMMGKLLSRGLNPVGLIRLATPGVERIDLLIDQLDSTLFHGATFEDLRSRPHSYLILNAGDMVTGTPFSFTQDTFNLLCSDLSKLKLSTAVAASAAFPVALSPVTLTNYSPCPAEKGKIPVWATNAAGSDWNENPSRVMRGRAAVAYAQGNGGDPADPAAPPKKYIHLLDGGITDNLGVNEPYRLLTSQDVSPSLFNRVSQGHVKRVIWVMINARSAPPSNLDTQHATPGMIDMFLGTVDSAIDSKSASNIVLIQDSLKAEWAAAAQSLPPELGANLKAASDHLYVIKVDFDSIADTACRRRFHSVPTSWTLTGQQIDGVMAAGPALLVQAPQFDDALKDIGGTWRGPKPSLADACRLIAGAEP